MTVTTRHAADMQPARSHRGVTRWFAGRYLSGSLIHLGLAAFRPTAYESFADGAYWPFIRHAWNSILVPNTRAVIVLLAAYELIVGVLLLQRGIRRRVGLIGATGFHVALLLFGWGIWIWAIPNLALLAIALRSTVPGPSALASQRDWDER